MHRLPICVNESYGNNLICNVFYPEKGPSSSFENNTDIQTDRPMDRIMDGRLDGPNNGHDLLQRCLVASKNEVGKDG